MVGKSLEEVCGMLLQTCLVCTLTVSAIGNAPENLGIASKVNFFMFVRGLNTSVCC